MLSNSDSVQPSSSLYKLFDKQARQLSEEIALLDQHNSSLTYSQLYRHITQIGAQLNDLGIGRNDRIAIVLPNGPEMAVAFLAIAASSTAAPLNPNYRVPEFEFYLSDLDAKALVIQAGTGDAAREVAKTKDIPIIELAPTGGRSTGLFALIPCPYSSFRQMAKNQEGFAQSSDIALVLHTSGTTSRPKIVPLRHSNLLASAQNIGRALDLKASDRCLNVMPLFHIHGLMASLLSSLHVGASVVCTPGFYAPRFFDWLAALKPTWYSAVPTMHQSILARADNQREIIEQSQLRFIRSSSASLPPQVMAKLEATFRAPVIESYGMTEASHQMASNPLPPAERKPGSVGIASGPDVAIMDEFGQLLPSGGVGEVVIRGANVTHGYESNPEANEKAFSQGWFRTGDLGYLDESHYLFLKGRIKEIINRAGEKISPREVDEVLLEHPAVAQAVTFAAPHTLLGEDVAVAVVLKAEKNATEDEIKRFSAESLADFKVPRVILFLDEIPKGPTGKLQRIGLADKLGLTASDPTEARQYYVPPRTPVEKALAQIWSEVLAIEAIGLQDNFFQLGGDSILATQISNRVRESMDVDLPFLIFFQKPTLINMAVTITQLQVEIIEDDEIEAILSELESS